jgi:DNA-binding transcriptional regulator YiaG
MAQFASLLKTEISRLARKEVRAEIETLKKASAQYRADIAALKRRLAEQQRLIMRLGKKSQRAAAAAAETESQGAALRFRSGGFASLRKKLDLSAAEMGKLLGVSLQTVYHWEHGKAKPRAAQLARIAEVRKLGKRAVRERLEA